MFQALGTAWLLGGMFGCGEDPGTVTPTEEPDKVWCFVEATQCARLRQEPDGTRVCIEVARNPDGTVKWVAQNGAAGRWFCFDDDEQTAEARCSEVCEELEEELHPPPGPGEPNCRSRPHAHSTHGDAVHPGECINDTGQTSSPLIIEEALPFSPTFDVSLVGTGSVTVDGTARNVALERGYASITAPDATCANSEAGECALRVSTLEVEYADFPFQGRNIQDLTVFLAGPTDALAIPIAGSNEMLFSLLPGTVFHATGLINGARSTIVVESLSELTGTYDVTTGAVTFSIEFSGQIFGATVSGTAFASSDVVFNRGPVANAGTDIVAPATTASCTAQVTLDASGSSDPDGDLDLLLWSTPDATLADGTTPTVTLAIGTHELTLTAFDRAGATAIDRVVVTVTDETLPTFAPAPAIVEQRSCEPGASTVTLPVPAASSPCSGEAATVTGRVISINGQAVSIPIVDGTATLPAGTSRVEWTATNANGSTTFVQTVEVTSEPTLFASGQLLLGDRVQVLAEGSAFGTAMSTGGDQTRLGNDADVGDLFTLPSVVLLDRFEVHGTLHHGADVQLGNNVVVASTVSDNDFDAPDLPVIPAFQGGAAIHLEPDTTATRAPGSYGDVIVKSRARLVLSPGVYTFTSLQVEPDAIVEVPADGSVQIFVRDSITYRGRVLASSGAPAPVLLGYAGSADVKLEAPFWGVALAPNARLVLETAGTDAPGRQHRGRFYARSLDVRAGARVLHDDLLCE
jgi:hypothetical protein